jgi:hypothetical protein
MSACKTPGAVFHISTHPDRVEVSVEFNRDIPITEEQAKALHERLHDALEAALAPVFGSAALEDAISHDEIKEGRGVTKQPVPGITDGSLDTMEQDDG